MNNDKNDLTEMTSEEREEFILASAKIFRLTMALIEPATVTAVGSAAHLLHYGWSNDLCQELTLKHCSVRLTDHRTDLIRQIIFTALEECGPSTCFTWEAAHHIYHCVYNTDVP